MPIAGLLYKREGGGGRGEWSHTNAGIIMSDMCHIGVITCNSHGCANRIMLDEMKVY